MELGVGRRNFVQLAQPRLHEASSLLQRYTKREPSATMERGEKDLAKQEKKKETKGFLSWNLEKSLHLN